MVNCFQELNFTRTAIADGDSGGFNGRLSGKPAGNICVGWGTPSACDQAEDKARGGRSTLVAEAWALSLQGGWNGGRNLTSFLKHLDKREQSFLLDRQSTTV